jgi:hypothetical protein
LPQILPELAKLSLSDWYDDQVQRCIISGVQRCCSC